MFGTEQKTETEKMQKKVSIPGAGNLCLLPIPATASPVSQGVLLTTKQIQPVESVSGVGAEEKE